MGIRSELGLLVAVALLLPGLRAQQVLGKAAPELAVKWLKGVPIDLTKTDGKVVVIECWSTSSEGSVAMLPRVATLQQRLGARGLCVVGVALFDELDEVRSFVAAHGDALGHALACEEGGKVARTWLEGAGPDALPRCFVLDRDRMVVWSGHPLAGLDQVVEEVLEGSFDPVVMRLLQEKAQELQRALDGRDWSKVRLIARAVMAIAPQRAEPWGLELLAAASAGDDPQQIAKLLTAALQALEGRPSQLAALVDRMFAAPLAPYLTTVRDAVRHALEQDKEHAGLNLALVRLLLAADDEHGAVKAALAAVAHLESDSQSLAALARILLETGHRRALGDAALAAVRRAEGAQGETVELLMLELQVLDLMKQDTAAAARIGRKIVDGMRGQADELNDFSWSLLTDDATKGRFVQLALLAAEAMTACKGWDEAHRLDTLALAKFENGRVDEAIALQKQAITKDDTSEEYRERLARYEKAKADSRTEKGTGAPPGKE